MLRTNVNAGFTVNKQRIQKGQSKMDNPEKVATRRRRANKRHITICVGHHYSQTNINDINKIGALLQTTGGKGELNIIFMQKS